MQIIWSMLGVIIARCTWLARPPIVWSPPEWWMCTERTGCQYHSSCRQRQLCSSQTPHRRPGRDQGSGQCAEHSQPPSSLSSTSRIRQGRSFLQRTQHTQTALFYKSNKEYTRCCWLGLSHHGDAWASREGGAEQFSTCLRCTVTPPGVKP